MLRIRKVEEAIGTRYGEQKMRCPVHLSIGQEAAAVGVCQALEKQDGVYSTHRSHAHYLAKGGNLTAFIAELYGLKEGCCKGVGGSMHLLDLEAGFLGSVPIVSATIPVAVGAAWAIKLKRENRRIVSFFGDGAFEEGVVHESLNFAALHELPILFVCENNQYSCYTSLKERQPKREIHSVAKAMGCVVEKVNGNKVEAVYHTTQNLLQQMKASSQPGFLEIETYRWREHCGPYYDDHLNYRPVGEREDWERKCPIERWINKHFNSIELKSEVKEIKQKLQVEIEKAFQLALTSKKPDPSELEGYLYA